MSSDESAETEKQIKKLDAALNIIHTAQKNFSEMFGGIEKIIENSKNTLYSLEEEKQQLETIKQDQENQISGLTDQQRHLLKEYEAVKEELEKFTRMAVEDGGEIKIEDMQATLAIYRVLLEEIWQSQPHFKVLWLLHGDREEMSVEQLKQASGISGAMILRACHELSHAKLIEFDPDEKKAKLVRRLFSRKPKKQTVKKAETEEA
jgi:archaellum component FlaC